MEHRPLTFQAINRSPENFYRYVYHVLRMGKDELVDLPALYPDRKIVIVDSCGWFYQQQFPQADIYKIEGIYMCKNVNMSRDKIDCLFDDTDFENLKFPRRPFDQSVLLIDHSPLMKYRDGQQIHQVLNAMTESVRSELVHLRMPLLTTNDYRFSDRVKEMSTIAPKNYHTTEFFFTINTHQPMLIAKFQRTKSYANSFN